VLCVHVRVSLFECVQVSLFAACTAHPVPLCMCMLFPLLCSRALGMQPCNHCVVSECSPCPLRATPLCFAPALTLFSVPWVRSPCPLRATPSCSAPALTLFSVPWVRSLMWSRRCCGRCWGCLLARRSCLRISCTRSPQAWCPLPRTRTRKMGRRRRRERVLTRDPGRGPFPKPAGLCVREGGGEGRGEQQGAHGAYRVQPLTVTPSKGTLQSICTPFLPSMYGVN